MIFKNFIRLRLTEPKAKTLIRLILLATVVCVRVTFASSSSPELNDHSLPSSEFGRRVLTVDLNDSQNFARKNCSRPAILEFPSDGLTREQRQHGWIILHVVVLIYGFLFLATICDDYLVPSIEQICSNLNIDHDVMGATAMAAALSSPELFMNFIGTFVTKGDIGFSTIVGSAVFNVLAVPGCCGLFALNYVQLDCWPITRDCLMYLLSIGALVGILSDGQIWWYEALFMILAYIGYMIIMHYNSQMSRMMKMCFKKCGFYRSQYNQVSEFTALLVNDKQNESPKCSAAVNASHRSYVKLYLEQQTSEEAIATPWSRRNQSLLEFIFRWPMTFLLWLTVPNSRQHHTLKYLTLLLSTLWIAAISYVVAFVITVIGDTLNLPDAAMGLTVLAYGMGVPEAVSSIIVTKQGQGCMGMSNTLGSNTFGILIGLGLPWFVKAFFFPQHAAQKLLQLDSTSLVYAGTMLLTSLLVLYVLLVWNKFTLSRNIGLSCLLMYISFMVIATLIELNVFFPLNMPKCRQ